MNMTQYVGNLSFVRQYMQADNTSLITGRYKSAASVVGAFVLFIPSITGNVPRVYYHDL